MSELNPTKEAILRGPRAVRTLRAMRAFERGFTVDSATDEGDAYRMRAAMDAHPAFGKWLSRTALGTARKPMAAAPGAEQSTFIDAAEIDAAVAGIREDGFYVFKHKAPAETVARILEFAESEPCTARGIDAAPAAFPRSAPIAGRYDFDEQTMMRSPDLQDYCSDPAMATIAARYLEQRVVQDVVTLWWTAPRRAEDAALNAWMFHQDRDRLSFLKFFMYVTDVEPDTGPHVYVRGTHRTAARSLRGDGRITDDAVRQAGIGDDIVELAGPAGTLMAVDTAGLHKGKAPERADRLVLQVQFSTSLFGAPFELPQFTPTPLAVERYRSMPRTLVRWSTIPELAP